MSRIRGTFEFRQPYCAEVDGTETSTQPCAIWPFGFRARMRKWTKRKKAPLLVNNFLCNLFFLEVSDCDGKPGEAV